MKKQVALGIAGATAALIAGWQLVRQMTDREEAAMDPVSVAPGMPRRAVEEGRSREGRRNRSEARSRKHAPPDASKAELYEIAQELGIEGRSKMSKAELIKAIEAAG